MNLVHLYISLALAVTSVTANASLNDNFIFSSKFGLTVESVTDSWTSLENGLTFGGQLNGVPRDTEHYLFYTNGRLSLVNIFYNSDQLNFETEKASRKWIYKAAEELREKASKKYGSPNVDSAFCKNEVEFTGCEGSIVWKGTNKVFSIRFFEKPYSKYREALYGYGQTSELVVTYSDARDYDLLSKRIPFLVKWYNERSERMNRVYLNSLFKYQLIKKKITLDELLLNHASLIGKVNEIKRKESIQYIGGVKANYDPKKWAKSFRLQ